MEPTLKVLSGRVYVQQAVAVRADTGRARPIRVPLVDGYFLAVFPRRTQVAGVAAVDRDGHVVAERRRGS